MILSSPRNGWGGIGESHGRHDPKRAQDYLGYRNGRLFVLRLPRHLAQGDRATSEVTPKSPESESLTRGSLASVTGDDANGRSDEIEQDRDTEHGERDEPARRWLEARRESHARTVARLAAARNDVR